MDGLNVLVVMVDMGSPVAASPRGAPFPAPAASERAFG
jgi:hypothetical protein